MEKRILRYLYLLDVGNTVTEELNIYGNSMGYKVSLDNKEISFSRLNIPTKTLDIAKEVDISGGNIRIIFPKEVEYNIELSDEKGVLSVRHE